MTTLPLMLMSVESVQPESDEVSAEQSLNSLRFGSRLSSKSTRYVNLTLEPSTERAAATSLPLLTLVEDSLNAATCRAGVPDDCSAFSAGGV